MMDKIDLDGLLGKLFSFDDFSIPDGVEVIRWRIKPSALFSECCTYNYGSYGG
jgi:hypothetical protein